MGPPPPLAPMDHTTNSYKMMKNKYKYKPNTNNVIKTEQNENKIKDEKDEKTKRRRQQNANNGDPHPFVQNVQIDLKALSNKKQHRLHPNTSTMTSSSSTGTDIASHDYSDLLLHSTSSVVRDAENEDIDKEKKEDTKKRKKNKNKQKNKKYVELLMNGDFDEVINSLNPLIPDHDKPGYPNSNKSKKQRKKNNDKEL